MQPNNQIPSYATTPERIAYIQNLMTQGNGQPIALNNGQDVYTMQNGQLTFNGQPISAGSGTGTQTIAGDLGTAGLPFDPNAYNRQVQTAGGGTVMDNASGQPNPSSTQSPVSSQLGALSTATNTNGVGNSTSGNQMLPGQVGASLGNIASPQTQTSQVNAINTDPNNITGYQNTNSIK